MTPKTEIQYTYDYAKRLYRGEKQFSEAWQDIIIWGGNFEAVYEMYIDKILDAIPKLTGYGWEEYADEFIPIYIVGAGDSFSRPLTIAADEDASVMMIDLLTQLVHQNIHYGFKEEGDRVSALHEVVRSIVARLDVDLGDALQDAVQRSLEHYGEQYRRRTWDLTASTARIQLERGQ